MKRIIFILSILSASLVLWAQNGNPLRIEIPARAGSSPFNYVSAGRQGLCIFYPTISETGRDSISWSFVMTDTDLKEIWNKQVPLHEDVTFLKSVEGEDAIYLLFHDTKRNENGNIFVFMIQPKLRLITEHRSMIPDKAEVVDFEIANNNAFVGYNNRKSQPGIVGFSLINGEKRSYDITAEKDALLLDVSVDTARKEVFATYKLQYSSSRNHLYVNRYNSPGALEKTFDFSEQVERRNINTAQFIPMGYNNGMVIGTYGYNVANTRRQYDYYNYYYNSYYYNYYSPYSLRQPDYDENSDNTPVSDGYFTARVTNGEPGKLIYSNFSTFSNSQKYITDVSALRSKGRPDKKSDNEKDVYDDKEKSMNLRLLTHEATFRNGYFILTSEAYSPEYHTNTQMSYDYYGRSFPTSYQVFDGFRYSHAFIAGFDSSGTMVWNNGMEMRDILTKYLNPKLNILFDNTETVLYYNANNKIAFKTIQNGKVLENTSYLQIPPQRPTDKAYEEYLGSIQHWYSDYYIATGYQSIRNNYMESNKRNVFYISKLAFR